MPGTARARKQGPARTIRGDSNALVVAGLVGGLAVPPLLAGVTIALTWIDRSHLEEVDWSAVHRNPVEWPSILALGPHGGLLIATFVLSGGLVVGFAAAMEHQTDGRRRRATAGLLAAAGVALALVALPADAPNAGSEASWHDRIHNLAYPVIPLGLLIAIGLTSFGSSDTPPWRRLALLSRGTLVIAAAAFLLTAVDSVAQLARYPLFGSLLTWMGGLALTLLSERRGLSRRG